MSTLVLEMDPVAVEVTVTDDDLTVALADGRRMYVPLSWHPRLFHASDVERQNWQLLGTAMRSNGLIWMSISASKGYWRDDKVVKAPSHSSAG